MAGVPPPAPSGNLPYIPPPSAPLTSADFLFGPSHIVNNDNFSIPNNAGTADFLGFAIPTMPTSAPPPPPKTTKKRARDDSDISQPSAKKRKTASKSVKVGEGEEDAEKKRRDRKRKREEKKTDKSRKKARKDDNGDSEGDKKDRKKLSKEERRELKKKKKEERKKKMKRELEKEKRLKREREKEESSRGQSAKGKAKGKIGGGTKTNSRKTEGREDEGREEINSDEEMDERALEADMQGEAERNKEILKQFTKDQLDRYQAYKTSKYPRKQYAKKRMVAATGRKVADSAPVVMMAITKVHIETARVVMEERGERGKIRPEHMRKAYTRLAEAGKMPYLKKRLFFKH